MANPPAPTNGGSGRRRVILFLVLLVVIASFFVGLSSLPLFDQADEARFAEAARVMTETGDYVTPTFYGRVRFAKPVLIYWLMVASYRVFGVGELGARLPSAAASAFTAMAIVWLVSRVAAGRAAWLAGIAWASFLQTAVWARLANTDATLTLFLTASYLALYLAFRSEAPRKRLWYLLAGAAMGLGFLTKGPIGVVLPAASGFLYLLSVRRLRAELRQARLWEPLVLFLLIAAPWYYLAYREHGSEFLRIFFLGENVQRFAGPAHREFGRLLYFLPFVLFMTFPFSALLPALVKRGWARPAEPTEPGGHSLPRYLLCWFFLVVVVFTFSDVKNPQYVMSAYPALAVFAGLYFDRLLRERPPLGAYEKVAIVLVAVLGAILTATAALLPRLLAVYAARHYAEPSEGVPLIAACLALMAGVGTLTVAGCWALRRRRLALGAMVATPWLLGLVAWLTLGPEVVSYRQAPLRDLCRSARRLVPEEAAIVVFGIRSSATVFYARRHVPVVPLHEPERVAEEMAEDERIGIIAPRREIGRLAALGPLTEWDRQGSYVLLGRDAQRRRGDRVTPQP
ncbi:MAG: ArnT family glycosyltransferase [Armatimonadota bacterium]